MSKESKKQNLEKMILDLNRKIEKLEAQKKIYELSLDNLKEESPKDETEEA